VGAGRAGVVSFFSFLISLEPIIKRLSYYRKIDFLLNDKIRHKKTPNGYYQFGASYISFY